MSDTCSRTRPQRWRRPARRDTRDTELPGRNYPLYSDSEPDCPSSSSPPDESPTNYWHNHLVNKRQTTSSVHKISIGARTYFDLATYFIYFRLASVRQFAENASASAMVCNKEASFIFITLEFWNVQKRTYQPLIGQLIQARRHSLFGHVVCLPPAVLCNAILQLIRDISMGRRIPPGWRKPRGRPCALWTSQLKRNIEVPTATSWRRTVDHQLWRKDPTALTGYAIWWRWWFLKHNIALGFWGQ